MPTNTYTVTGMTCQHCVTSVTEEVSEIPGVTDIQVELSTGALTVTSDTEIAGDTIRAAVTEAGYQLG